MITIDGPIEAVPTSATVRCDAPGCDESVTTTVRPEPNGVPVVPVTQAAWWAASDNGWRNRHAGDLGAVDLCPYHAARTARGPR
ncbi:hypothetical protein GCM10027067_26600 [Pseudactinotalea suaedae]